MIATPKHLLIHTCTIRRKTVSNDASNFPKGSYADHLTNIQCRIQPMNGSESIRYGGESNRRLWRVFTETGLDITEKDRIQFEDVSRGTSVTRTLDIQEMRNPQQFGTLFTIIGEETDG